MKNNSSTPKRLQAKQQLSQLMGLSQKDLNKLLFDDKNSEKPGVTKSSTPKSTLNRSSNATPVNQNYFTSTTNKSQKMKTQLDELVEDYKPSFSSSKSPIRKAPPPPPQLSQSPILLSTILSETKNQPTTPTQKKDFYFSVRKSSKTPPKKALLTPLMINDDSSIERERIGANGSVVTTTTATNNGEKNIQSYLNQFESVLSPVSTTSVSYSTINPYQEQGNYQTNSNNHNNSSNIMQNPFQSSYNTTQSHSPYANSQNNLTKQFVSISNQTEKFFKSPSALAQSSSMNLKQKSGQQQQQQGQQIWKAPQNQQKQAEIVTEKQIILQDLKNKILSMKVNAKDTVFLTNQIKEKFEQTGRYSYEFMEEKNIFVLKYYIHLAHEEIDRLVQKKKNLLLSRNQAFNQFLSQFISGANKSKILLKDEYYNLLPSAIDLKEIVSKDIALLYKNLEKENNQQLHPASSSQQQSSPKKQIVEDNQTNHAQQQPASTPTKSPLNVDVSTIPNEIKQLIVKANLQITTLQSELETEKQKVKLYCEANSIEEGFDHELKSLKIQNSDLRKQIQELNSENGNLFRKFNESEKLYKQLKEENQSLNSKVLEKGQRLETLYKDLEECKVSLQQMISAQQNEKSAYTISLQESDAKYNILNEKNKLLEERIKSKEDQLHQKENEILVMNQKLEDLKNLQEINQLLLDVDKKDHNLVTNLICLVNKFENNELPRNTQITVIKYFEKLNLLCKFSSLLTSQKGNSLQAQSKQELLNQQKRAEKIKCINNQTLHLLNSYMQKLMDKIVKQQVLHEELIWFKDNIERLVEKFLQMSKNQISFNHIDFFKQEIQIKYERIQQKISQISPDIEQLESEMREIAADQVQFIKNDFEESTDELQESIDRNEIHKENSKLKQEIQHLNSQLLQLTIKDQLISSSLASSQNKKQFK